MIYFLAIFLCVSAVNARVLNLAEEKFASYFSAEMSTIKIENTPFDNLVSGVDSYSESFKQNYGGEFGFIYATPYVAWRFSFEFLKPSKLSEVQASQAGVNSYLVSSDLTTVAPKIGLQLNLNRRPDRRLYLFGFYGTSNLTMTNSYTQAPIADHTVYAKSVAPDTGGGIGLELGFVDTTSFCLELGYRSLNFKEIKYSKDVDTFQGNKLAGDELLDINNNNVQIDFTSYYASIGFRFWL